MCLCVSDTHALVCACRMEEVEDIVLGVSESLEAQEAADYEEHSWVQWYQKSWLEIQEGASGRLEPVQVSVPETFAGGGASCAIRKGLLRFVYILIDFSESLLGQCGDYKPNKPEFLLDRLCVFIDKFFAENPLSYLAVAVMREGRSEFVTRMTGQPNFQKKNLRLFFATHVPSGVCSFSKGLELIRKAALDLPTYASREVCVLWSSMATVDDIPIAHDSSLNVRILSVSPEIFALKIWTTVALNSADFSNKLDGWVAPSAPAAVKPVYVKMGFPLNDSSGKAKCACHKTIVNAVYVCPQCGAFACEIPTRCAVCELTLVEKDMLTRVHRLLYTMPSYRLEETPRACFGCGDPNACKSCVECTMQFCGHCDTFAHEVLKHCPGCL